MFKRGDWVLVEGKEDTWVCILKSGEPVQMTKFDERMGYECRGFPVKQNTLYNFFNTGKKYQDGYLPVGQPFTRITKEVARVIWRSNNET